MSKETQNLSTKERPKLGAIPENLLHKKVTKENELLMKEFIEAKKSYEDSYIKLLLRSKINQNKPLNKYTTDDIYNHIDLLEKNNYASSSIRNFLAHMRSFAAFLKENFPDDFPSEYLDGLNDIPADITINNPKSKFIAFELNIHQLDAIREYISDKRKTQFIFELYFQLGIDKQDVPRYCKNNYNSKEKAFYEDGELLKECTPLLAEIISSMSDKDWFGHIGNTHYHLKKITDYLITKGLFADSENLTYSDIVKTRDRFFLQCPYCHRDVENIQENWVLVKAGENGSTRLCCVLCKGGMLDGED
jgi:hypothetical protein